MSGSLDITLDRAKGFIGIEGQGVWSMDVLQTHFGRLRDLVPDMRAGSGMVKVLIDLRLAGQQSSEAEDLIRVNNLELYGTADRVAMLIAAYLHKPELKPLVAEPNRRMFDDPVAALRWLEGVE